MTVDTPMCTPFTSIENIQKLMHENDSEEILVVDSMLEKHLVGIIHETDIIKFSQDQNLSPESLNAELFMRPVSITGRENISLEECQRILDENHLEHLAIVDDEGHLCGVYDRVNHLKIEAKIETTTEPKKMQTRPEAQKVAEDMKPEEKSASAGVNVEVAEDEDPEAEKMESEGGHDSHTVH